MTRVNETGEFGLIERVSRILNTSDDVVVDIGDDCAVLRVSDSLVLVSCDLFMENIHFRREHAGPEGIGWKAAAVALSDIAAMGGQPKFALVSFACPGDTDVSFVENLFKGMNEAMSCAGAVIVGGDTTRSPGEIVIDVTVIGEAVDGRYLTRKGAMPGDLLAVTGHLGRSSAGLHALENANNEPNLIEAHYHPVPRIREGQWFSADNAVHAMLDVSDGLIQDAGHLLESGQSGVDIEPENIRIHHSLTDYCEEHDLCPLDFILTGGEDYELILALDPQSVDETLDRFQNEFDTALTVIGEFNDKWKGIKVAGKRIDQGGYDHFKF